MMSRVTACGPSLTVGSSGSFAAGAPGGAARPAARPAVWCRKSRRVVGDGMGDPPVGGPTLPQRRPVRERVASGRGGTVVDCALPADAVHDCAAQSLVGRGGDSE